jgi:transposase
MQKTLTQMNVQLANVISDISGATGMAILRAIIAGGRTKPGEISHSQT